MVHVHTYCAERRVWCDAVQRQRQKIIIHILCLPTKIGSRWNKCQPIKCDYSQHKNWGAKQRELPIRLNVSQSTFNKRQDSTETEKKTVRLKTSTRFSHRVLHSFWCRCHQAVCFVFTTLIFFFFFFSVFIAMYTQVSNFVHFISRMILSLAARISQHFDWVLTYNVLDILLSVSFYNILVMCVCCTTNESVKISYKLSWLERAYIWIHIDGKVRKRTEPQLNNVVLIRSFKEKEEEETKKRTHHRQSYLFLMRRVHSIDFVDLLFTHFQLPAYSKPWNFELLGRWIYGNVLENFRLFTIARNTPESVFFSQIDLLIFSRKVKLHICALTINWWFCVYRFES